MAFKDYQLAAKSAWNNPKLAAQNTANRFKRNIGGNHGASKNTNFISGIKAALTPQRAYASVADPGMVQTGGNYSLRAKYNADGQTIGFDYFLNGQPITEQEYANAGMNLSGDQELAIKDLQINDQNSIINRLSTNTNTESDGTGGNAFVPVTFLGQTYTDPESLAIAKKNYLDLLNREKLQEIVSGLNRYVGGENATWDTVGGEIGENKTSFLNKIAQYLDEYNKGEEKDYGKIRGYYSGLGDMYQSSQEIRNKNVADEYNTARTDLNRQKTEGLTGLQRTFQDYIDSANSNKTALSRNYLTSLDELANANESDIQDTVAKGLGGTSVQITNPDVQKANTGTSTSLLNSLQRVKNNVFRINRGDNTEQNILSYLYQGL